MKYFKLIAIFFAAFLYSNSYAQMKLTFLNQAWVRYTDNNPGSLVDGSGQANTFDIGLRRTRMQYYGNISPKVFVYTQVGLNNLAYNSVRKQGVFLHDACAEYSVLENKLSVGTGLTGWNGLSRYAAPGVGSILSLDAPLYQQYTNDVNDQFVRKFSLYFKGKFGKLDYRMIISKPMSVDKASVQIPNLHSDAEFAKGPAHLTYHGYFMFQMKDQESNQTAYNTGCYLGKKDVFNIGLGAVYQKNALWYSVSDTVYHSLFLANLDFFYDHPINKEKNTAITSYLAFQYSDYGKNYLRNIGPMNPTNGISQTSILNGSGNNVPLIGTGETVFFQFGALLPKSWLKVGQLQPYICSQVSNFSKIGQPIAIYNLGLNCLIDGHRSKLSLDIQNRPVIEAISNGVNQTNTRKNMIVLQYQINI